MWTRRQFCLGEIYLVAVDDGPTGHQGRST